MLDLVTVSRYNLLVYNESCNLLVEKTKERRNEKPGSVTKMTNMKITNEQNPNKTAIPSTKTNRSTREGYHKKKELTGVLTQEQSDIVSNVHYRMDMAFSKFVHEKNWSNDRIVDEFYPAITQPSAVTKILKGEQRVNIETILILALRFGKSLDEMLLGEKQAGYSLTPEDTAFLSELVKKSCQCSSSKKSC